MCLYESRCSRLNATMTREALSPSPSGMYLILTGQHKAHFTTCDMQSTRSHHSNIRISGQAHSFCRRPATPRRRVHPPLQVLHYGCGRIRFCRWSIARRTERRDVENREGASKTATHRMEHKLPESSARIRHAAGLFEPCSRAYVVCPREAGDHQVFRAEKGGSSVSCALLLPSACAYFYSVVHRVGV